jgi:diaminopropionate ammonia-lyase
VLVPGTFDDCVQRCAAEAKKNGWQAISDTAYPGYMEIPTFIMLGYTTIFREMEDSLHKKESPGVDAVLLPAGVGGLAAAGVGYYVRRYGEKRPTLVCVEPSDCDCFLESARYGKGKPLPTRGKQRSIMAGLNCGIPSPVAWPIIRDGMHLFIAVPDHYAEEAMRVYSRENIVSGESGASGLAGLLALMRDPLLLEARKKTGLGKNSRVLLINTEGDTDPVNYKRIVG